MDTFSTIRTTAEHLVGIVLANAFVWVIESLLLSYVSEDCKFQFISLFDVLYAQTKVWGQTRI